MQVLVLNLHFSNSLAVLRLPMREKFVPSRVIFLFSVSDWIFDPDFLKILVPFKYFLQL
jgi:hypothetical protein